MVGGKAKVPPRIQRSVEIKITSRCVEQPGSQIQETVALLEDAMTDEVEDNIYTRFPSRVWKTPDSYHGYNPVGHFCVATKNRGSSLLEECNFASAAARLEPFNSDDTAHTDQVVYVWKASHWGVGWVEYLMMRPEASPPTQEEVLKIINELEEYPVLDENAYHLEGLKLAEEWWDGLSQDEQNEMLDDIAVARPEEGREEKVNYIIDNYKQDL